VNSSSAPQPPKSRTSIRMDARLDARTRAKVDDLANRFHQPRAAVLSYIMEWALSRGQAATRDGGEAEGTVCHLYLYVDTALHARVEQVASAAGMKIAPWLRAMVRQITLTDFPPAGKPSRSARRPQARACVPRPHVIMTHP
jgi:hypothetical protein